MGTLLKYEFRRSRVIFLGIIGVTLLVELLYLVGWCFKLETPLLLGIIACSVWHSGQWQSCSMELSCSTTTFPKSRVICSFPHRGVLPRSLEQSCS